MHLHFLTLLKKKRTNITNSKKTKKQRTFKLRLFYTCNYFLTSQLGSLLTPACWWFIFSGKGSMQSCQWCYLSTNASLPGASFYFWHWMPPNSCMLTLTAGCKLLDSYTAHSRGENRGNEMQWNGLVWIRLNIWIRVKFFLKYILQAYAWQSEDEFVGGET